MISISDMWVLRHRSLRDIPKDTEEDSVRDEKLRVPNLSALLTNHKTSCFLHTSEIFPLLLRNWMFRCICVLDSFIRIPYIIPYYYNLTKFLRETVKGQNQISATLALGNSRAWFFWVGCWQVLVKAAGVLLFCNSPGHVPERSKDLLWLRVLGTSTDFLAEHRCQLDCVQFSDYRSARADVPFDKSQRIWPPGNQFIKFTKPSPSPD